MDKPDEKDDLLPTVLEDFNTVASEFFAPTRIVCALIPAAVMYALLDWRFAAVAFLVGLITLDVQKNGL